MKTVSILAASAFLASGAAAATAYGERKLIVGGEAVPTNSKLYTVGIREDPFDPNFCAGALISLTHVLTSPNCVNGTSPSLWVSVGSNYIIGVDGEMNKVVSAKTHPKFDNDYVSYAFAVLELELPVNKVKPVQLADADDPHVEVGTVVTSVGLGFTSVSSDGSVQSELQRMDVRLWGEEECSSRSEATLCGSAGEGKGVCLGDSGNPLIVESETGKDSDDVLLGVLVGSEFAAETLEMAKAATMST
ncbi:serine protease trypsin-like protein [Phytophthora sojae]|uniref:Serine protease trypsin-like protein n=1 Tax=Phytophthora sojae (strain P6497) TaxID=1094619 RepID=G5A818_PHYSP|nr:serine protease trypsin-like protein [Phytophthora sojae]EGZ08044.1 serine protease trypsin-like protein [Phytophthora sojae]|eukprot:XP_009536216.1 serine protease trypsin-like protein [Phytophthora sojae]